MAGTAGAPSGPVVLARTRPVRGGGGRDVSGPLLGLFIRSLVIGIGPGIAPGLGPNIVPDIGPGTGPGIGPLPASLAASDGRRGRSGRNPGADGVR